VFGWKHSPLALYWLINPKRYMQEVRMDSVKYRDFQNISSDRIQSHTEQKNKKHMLKLQN